MGNRLFKQKSKNKNKNNNKTKKSKKSTSPPSAALLHLPSEKNEVYDSLSGDFDGFKVPRRLSTVPGRPNKIITIDTFVVLKVLGRGSFGKVCLVRKKDDERLFALKALNKDALLRRNQVAHTQTERMILSDIRHPFLVQLEFAFQSDTRLYLVLEFMRGGELFYWLRRAKRFSVCRAKLYAAEVLLALEFLHTNDIVYRDLKPENILLDPQGHLKLTDFGLSKEGITGHGAENGTTTFCGTPEYLAPEILSSTGHGKSVDWWSLGILICEMITGDPPFYDKNVQQMYRLILHAEPNFTHPLGEDARDLLNGLLTRDIDQRLGSNPERDSLDIRKHIFFKHYSPTPDAVETLQWERVLKKDYRPVFVPPVSDIKSDKLNIDNYYMKSSTKDSVVIQMTSEQIEKTKFEGFSYHGNEEDGSALSKLRRNSNNPTSWEFLMRRSLSSGSRASGSDGMMKAFHKRDLSGVVEEKEIEGKGEMEKGVTVEVEMRGNEKTVDET